MYEKEHIDLLNEFGMISVCLLMRRFKISRDEALLILKSIEQNHKNVYTMSKEKICIEGREPIKEKKRSRWIDVTKP